MDRLTIYSDEELKKIQKTELEVLQEIIRICEILDIDYFLIDGAALGAVRHKGFIPWDDDIDVGMTRADYRIFLARAPTLLNRKYYLQTPYRGCKNPYFYTKIRVKGTKFVEYCNRELDIPQGIYIDICPFDEVPDREWLNKIQFYKCQFLIRLFVLRQSPDLSAPPETIQRKMLSVIRKRLHRIMQKVPYRMIAVPLERETRRYNGTGQNALAFLHYPIRKTDYIYKKELYELKEQKFNGLTVKIPHDCETYLTRHYGNYTKWPAPEKRYGHKPCQFKV